MGFANVALLVQKSLARHALSTTVTVLSTALASGLVMAVVAVTEQAEDAFTGGSVGFDAVLGARGSKLQLVLNTVFHLQTSPGNLPWSEYERIAADPRVELALPYAVGDNYEGFRIVGTTEELFTRFELEPGEPLAIEPGGRAFDPRYREAVVGATVARETGLALGDPFAPYHGLTFDPHHHEDHHVHDEDEYLVVGVLEPTNTPNDRVIWIPIEGLFRMEGHQLRGAGQEFVPEKGAPIPTEHKEVSAVMLAFADPRTGFALDEVINRQGKDATFAWPIAESLAEFFAQLDWIVRVLTLVAWLVAVVAAGSILASIYNAMNERRREFAVLRALGARRSTVFAAIVGEAAAIALLGSLVGYALFAAIFALAASLVRAETGVVLTWSFHPILVATPIAMLALGAIAGLLPARKAYRTDVASTLAQLG